MLEALEHIALHADGFQAELAAAFVQQPQHCALAMGAGQRADPHIHRAGADAQADAAVLRQTLFRNIQVRHDFQAGNQRGVQRPVGLHHLAQGTIDPKAHTGMALVRLDVNVTGAVARGLGQQCIEHADDGRVVRGFQQILHRGQVLHHAGQVNAALHFADHRGCAGLAFGISGADALGQRAGVRQLQAQRRDTGTVFAEDLADRASIRAGVVPQRQGVTIIVEQQRIAAGKRVRKGVAQSHGRQSVGKKSQRLLTRRLHRWRWHGRGRHRRRRHQRRRRHRQGGARSIGRP